MNQQNQQAQARGPVVAKQPNDISFVVDRMLKRLDDTKRDMVLSVWANADLQAVNRLIINELQHMMAELSTVDYLDNEEFGKVRTQVVAVSSILSDCNQKGRKFAEANHELNKPSETETPIV